MVLPLNLPLIKFWIGLISFGGIWKIKENTLISWNLVLEIDDDDEDSRGNRSSQDDRRNNGHRKRDEYGWFTS